MNKKIISALLAVLFLVSSVNASAASTSAHNLTAAKNFALSEVASFIDSGDEIVTWDNTTRISSHIELYAPDDTLNGYIFKFETQGTPSGYMQIGVLDSSYFVMNLGFEGNDYLTSMLEANSIDADILEDQIVYYAGNMNYYIYHDGVLVDLVNEEPSKLTSSDIDSLYNGYKTQIRNDISQTTKSTRSASSMIYAMVDNVLSSSLKPMNYYSGYSNHCAPTAATNLVLYWSACRGKTALGTNAATIFTGFHSAMGTTSNGTIASNIYAPINSYFSSKLSTGLICGTYNWSSSSSALHYDTMKQLVDGGIPMLLGITNWTSGSTLGHAVNVWGYNIMDGTNYLYISNNQDSDAYCSISLINYSSYTYNIYVYAGYAS